jgi:hypothetical protein
MVGYQAYDKNAQLDHSKLNAAKLHQQLDSHGKPINHPNVNAAVSACFGLRPTKDRCEFYDDHHKLVTGICWHGNAPDAIAYCSKEFADHVASWELSFSACFTTTNMSHTHHPGQKCEFFAPDSKKVHGLCLPKKFMAIHTHFENRKHSFLELDKHGVHHAAHGHAAAHAHQHKSVQKVLYCADNSDKDAQLWVKTATACHGKKIAHGCEYAHAGKHLKGLCVDSEEAVGLKHPHLYCSVKPKLHPETALKTYEEYKKLAAAAEKKVIEDKAAAKKAEALAKQAKIAQEIISKAAKEIASIGKAGHGAHKPVAHKATSKRNKRQGRHKKAGSKKGAGHTKKGGKHSKKAGKHSKKTGKHSKKAGKHSKKAGKPKPKHVVGKLEALNKKAAKLSAEAKKSAGKSHDAEVKAKKTEQAAKANANKAMAKVHKEQAVAKKLGLTAHTEAKKAAAAATEAAKLAAKEAGLNIPKKLLHKYSKSLKHAKKDAQKAKQAKQAFAHLTQAHKKPTAAQIKAIKAAKQRYLAYQQRARAAALKAQQRHLALRQKYGDHVHLPSVPHLHFNSWRQARRPHFGLFEEERPPVPKMTLTDAEEESDSDSE